MLSLLSQNVAMFTNFLWLQLEGPGHPWRVLPGMAAFSAHVAMRWATGTPPRPPGTCWKIGRKDRNLVSD